MAYDGSRNEIVLFGGSNGGGYLNDTWTWNGTNWIQKTTATAPIARFLPKLVYEPIRRAAGQFGG